jgi:DNA repair protein RecN (Recombination protein N)
MITTLSISNYALIKKLGLSPSQGLNIITGETGAGKSIMLGAVGLLLGKRADVKALLDKETKCVVEAEFEVSNLGLNDWFDAVDIDFESLTILRREISPKGKSRAFINDTPVTLDIIKALGLKLIDIHSQNESIQLGDKSVKLKILDDFAGIADLVNDFQSKHKAFAQLHQELAALCEEEKSLNLEADYKRFLLEELLVANLEIEEQKQYEEELQLLEHAEEIKLKLSQVANAFGEGEAAFNDLLKDTSYTLKNLASYSKELEELSSRFESATEEIVDVIGDVQRIQSGVAHDPARMEEIGARLNTINTLLQKHKVTDVAELIAIRSRLESEAENNLDLEEKIEKLQVELEILEKKMLTSAEKLSQLRRQHVDQFSGDINSLLKEVGMPDGHVEMVYRRVEPWKMGIDEVEFLFSANKGVKPEPVGNIASGGEFSRLMFCVKYLLADKTAMPTVIFDEIDTGVSGEIAMKMATMMRKMAKNHQIIAISHLPQIAARGDSHYFVYKNNESEQTESLIRKLESTDRLEEIAKMIGGDNPSDSARKSAAELMHLE